MSADDQLAAARSALAVGQWDDARVCFEHALRQGESAEARFGLATALWWLGETRPSITACTNAYSLYQRSGDVDRAVQCAVWLAIIYKSNFANHSAANGWIRRAERLLTSIPLGPPQGWVWVARGYRMLDLKTAEDLTQRAVDLAQSAADVDLEIVGLAQLGLIRVSQGDESAGFAVLDEAMAAALAGERTTLDTVVYACCDMLSACELASDMERAAEWCRVADEFVERYGCPFLYAECRIYYGSVLAATGRWEDAARQLDAGVRITAESCPALHRRGLARLAWLRIRQGRLDEAAALMDQVDDVGAEVEPALVLAALLLERGDPLTARHMLERRLPVVAEHRYFLMTALDLLVTAHLDTDDVTRAAETAELLAVAAAERPGDPRSAAMAAEARGRVAASRGDSATATVELESALRSWSAAGFPFESARTRFELARNLAAERPDVATDEARRALITFEALGARRQVDRSAELLRRLGAVGRSVPRSGETLTAREQEVLGLLGAGLSNPEIAARLYISRKTASHHVSNVLAKLQLRNRAEAAAYAASARLGS